MTILGHALALAAEGFYVFPVSPGAKTPAVKGWQSQATRDPALLKAAFTNEHNIGIYTGRFAENEALLVIDVDNKGDKHGSESLLALELAGHGLPPTRAHDSPSDGQHLIYRTAESVRQGANVLGPGLDIRSRGGYIVGPGSALGNGRYSVADPRPIAEAPGWLVERLCASRRPRAGERDRRPELDAPPSAGNNARRYLENDAPLAVEGQGGDETTYKVACRLKDIGLAEPAALAAMLEHWNGRCSPPWSPDDLAVKVANAYRYGTEPQGSAAPENDFNPVMEPGEKLHPFGEINKQYAYVVAGNSDHILFETRDIHGRSQLAHLDINTFHRKHAAVKLPDGKKTEPVTKLWLEWKGRRSYDGLVFMPERNVPDRFYNLWRGFAVEALPPDAAPSVSAQTALDAFLEHTRLNVCNGNEALYEWLISYCAHIVQRPWEKPLTALVFRGKKGTGKNAFIDRIGALLGQHYLLTSNRRYLVGNFNQHLENCLLFVLDEAVWAGDKQGEGVLKDLITGKTHLIEPKGSAAYSVDNHTRVVIIGNENWLVPASHDERRFVVFEVGDGRRANGGFFTAMREGMERDGYPLLLRFLKDRNLDGFDPNSAPVTAGLIEQKFASLDPLHQWWHECLEEGRVVDSDFGADWPSEIDCESLRQALSRHLKKRGIATRLPEMRAFGRQLRECCPDLGHKQARGGNKYLVPELEACRASWKRWLGET